MQELEQPDASRDSQPASQPASQPDDGWRYELAGPERLPEVTIAACHGMSEQRRGIVLAVLQDIVRTGRGDQLCLGFAESDRARGGAVVVRSTDDSATLLAFGHQSREPTEPVIDARRNQKAGNRIVSSPNFATSKLLDRMHQWLAERGVTFIQATSDAGGPAPMGNDIGYHHLAVLDYMMADARETERSCNKGWSLADKPLPPDMEFTPYLNYFASSSDSSTGHPLTQLVRLVDRTYVGSLDCPAIARFRSTDKVLGTYKVSLGHDPSLWFVTQARESTEPSGCILLTPHQAGDAIEITYMGLVPEARGLGLARQLLRTAASTSSEEGLHQLSLAVDRENHPAKRLYEKSGFQQFFSESVWGRTVGVFSK